MIALAAAVYGSMSLLAFLLYAADKRRATRREWRISESALHLVELAHRESGGLFALINVGS